ncbi:MAG TPA: hypothetical protein VEF04_20005 [Blastocatellia bacterium]|nr:hypothetical protein [Blastocatellia bacterium]
MAVEGQQIKHSFIAGGDLSAKQYHFVKMSANDTVVVCSAVTDKPIGVVQNAPASGGTAEVCLAGITKVSGDADLGYGDSIGTSSDGQAAAYVAGTDTTKYPVGQVIEDNAAAGGLVTAAINCLSVHRGA